MLRMAYLSLESCNNILETTNFTHCFKNVPLLIQLFISLVGYSWDVSFGDVPPWFREVMSVSGDVGFCTP